MTRPGSALRGALLLACAVACAPAGAQIAPSAAAASAAERAQKEADRTMYWIRVLATKPAPAKAAPRPVVAAAPAARPVAEAHDKVKVAAATTPATGTVSDAPGGANAAPARVALAQAPTLSQPPIVSAPDTSALSSSHADDVASGVADSTPPEAAPQPAEPDPGLSQVKLVQPDFPPNIVRRVRKGNVEVRFEVDPDGTVSDAVVVQTSNSHLNDAAIDAIKQWRFKPTPLSHTAAVNLVFDIDKE